MSEEYSFKVIKHGSQLYQLTVQLRDTVLRQPLDLNFSSEELANEFDSFHLGCFQDDKLLACLVLNPISTSQIQMRQVVVDPSVQGKGVGREIVKYSEKFASDHDFTEMILHSRETAISFYETHGYTKRGDCFLEVSIPHWAMSKMLANLNSI